MNDDANAWVHKEDDTSTISLRLCENFLKRKR